jgi:methyltransferase (TIGR00027 family)
MQYFKQISLCAKYNAVRQSFGGFAAFLIKEDIMEEIEDKKPSVTAFINCFARAYHSINSSQKIFDDFLAREIFSDEHWSIMEQNLAASYGFFNPGAVKDSEQSEALEWLMREMMAPVTLSRSRFTEDKLDEAIRNGITQYVILGSGLDTFAFRHSELLSRVRVFDLDHPVTQSFKRNRINELGWDIPDKLEFIPVDFTKDDFIGKLLSSSYNPGEPGFFSWLGVTYYLPEEVIFDMLRSIAKLSCSGISIVFDYPDKDSFDKGKASGKAKLTREIVDRAGETMKGGLDPATLDSDLDTLGLVLRENLSPDDINKAYFDGRNDGYCATEHTYFALAEVCR